jgi:hypothetical protein
MACPPLVHSLVIAEDARLAAQICCALAVPGSYLPVIEGPLLLHPESDTELVRRNNAAGRVRPDVVFMTGLADKPHDALMERFAAPLTARARRMSTAEDIDRLADPTRFKGPPLAWGIDRIGIGLLKALRARRSINFTDAPSPEGTVPSLSDHLVVCEQGEPLAEVIAANYAYALRAGLCLIPEVGRELTDELLEGFYSLYEDRSISPPEALERPTVFSS